MARHRRASRFKIAIELTQISGLNDICYPGKTTLRSIPREVAAQARVIRIYQERVVVVVVVTRALRDIEMELGDRQIADFALAGGESSLGVPAFRCDSVMPKTARTPPI